MGSLGVVLKRNTAVEEREQHTAVCGSLGVVLKNTGVVEREGRDQK